MWPLYLINLARDTGRLDRARAAFGALGLEFERIEAVDGRALDPARRAEVYDDAANRRAYKADLVPAEIGCYLSHIAAWRRIADGPAPGGAVFEDDAAPQPGLPEALAAIARGTPYGMVKLYAKAEGRTLASAPLTPQHRLVEPYKVPNWLIGYTLTHDAARHLADTALPFARPVDEDQKYFWETGLRVGLVLPPPVALGDQSAAEATVSGEKAAATNPAPLRKLRYRAGYLLALWRARHLGAGVTRSRPPTPSRR